METRTEWLTILRRSTEIIEGLQDADEKTRTASAVMLDLLDYDVIVAGLSFGDLWAALGMTLPSDQYEHVTAHDALAQLRMQYRLYTKMLGSLDRLPERTKVKGTERLKQRMAAIEKDVKEHASDVVEWLAIRLK